MMVSLVPSGLAIFLMEAGNYGKDWTCSPLRTYLSLGQQGCS